MTISKKEWDDFWKSIPGDDWYYNCSNVPERVDDLQPGDTFSFTEGVMCWQGSGHPKSVPGLIVVDNEDDDYHAELVSVIRKWRKMQATVTMVVEAHKDCVDAVRKAVIAAGGKVVA